MLVPKTGNSATVNLRILSFANAGSIIRSVPQRGRGASCLVCPHTEIQNRFRLYSGLCAPHCARALLGAGCIGNGPRGERDAFSKTRTIVALRKWLRQIHPEADRLGDYRTDRYLLLRRPRRGGAGEAPSARSSGETVGVQSVPPLLI